jgi:hypothetical protein
MTARTDYLQVHPAPPNIREVYKCLSKEISVMWRTKGLPISLPPRALNLGITLFSPAQRLLEIHFCL